MQSIKFRMRSTEFFMQSIQKSSSREHSMQEKLVTREMHQSFIKSFRESSITKIFLRQSSSSSSQSKVQEILSSKISTISENFYSDQCENSYSRQSQLSEKKSTLRQPFQFRFSKFYKSSQLSKQFYR